MLVVIVTVSLSQTFAQKCKPKVSVVDEFTEQKIEGWGGKMDSSRNMFQGVSQTLNFFVGELDNKMFAEISVQYMQKGGDASVNNIDIPKGTKFMLKTADGIVTFIASKSKKAKRKSSGYTITVIELTSELTQEKLEKLANKPITMYRIVPEESEPIKGEVSRKKAEKLQVQFTCFLNNK